MRSTSAQLRAGRATLPALNGAALKSIASRENPHFKALRKLCQSGRERRKSGQTLLDGMHLIEAWTQRFGEPLEILVSESGVRRAETAAWLAATNARITTLGDALFAELATVDTPSGIMALVAQPQPALPPNSEADALLLDGVQDPGNVGSILRSAAAAGVRQVLMSADCAHAWSPKTLRAAMGAHFELSIHEGADLPAFLGDYRGQAVATALDGAVSLHAADLRGPQAWVFGSEGQGVGAACLAATRLRVRIPMPGAVESLNVGAAAAICLFEMVRQRLATPG